MKTHLKTLLCAASVLALAACTEGSQSDFFTESGAGLDEGGFGNPTMNNILVHSGERDYRIALGRRFAEEVPTMVNFAFNSTALDAEAQAILRRQADWIRQFPEIRFRVYGHTDAVGSNAYNQRLGLRRAQTVVSYLVSQGVSRSRLEAVVSRGETQPLVVTEGRERRNRRTVTDVMGFVGEHPLVLNGKYAEVIWREYVESATELSTVETADAIGEGAE